MVKILSLILMVVGLALIAVKTVLTQFADKIPFIAGVDKLYLIIAGVVLIVLGILMLKMGGSHASGEIPIYEGNKIVGYRRK